MADVVVDQKPMPQLPVDPAAKIPDAVRRRSAEVDEFYRQQQTSPAPATTPSPDSSPQATVPSQPPLDVQPPPPADEPQLPLETPPPPPPAAEKMVPGSEVNVTQATIGRNQALQRQLGEMEEQLRQLAQENLRYQQMLQKRNNGSQHQPVQPTSHLTADDERNFGPEFLDVVRRGARDAMAPEVSRLEQENEELRAELQKNSTSTIDRTLDRTVPNWRQVNQDPRFHNWLLLPDPYSGVIRDKLLKAAAAAVDPRRVARFFEGFLAEEAATGHIESSPAPPPATPPRAAAVQLDSLASPGRARPSPGGTTTTPEKPTYTPADIERYSREYLRGRIPEDDYRRLEADIIAAGREGRVIK